MNIAKILKDCPKGTKLYSPLFGEVEFIEIISDNISVETCKFNNAYFDVQGRYKIGYDNTECLLFPSKDNRDWSTFKLPKKEYDFKPFDRVLVRDLNDDNWFINFYECIEPNSGYFVCMSNIYKQCIPYEGNEHLLGTTNSPD